MRLNLKRIRKISLVLLLLTADLGLKFFFRQSGKFQENTGVGLGLFSNFPVWVTLIIGLVLLTFLWRARSGGERLILIGGLANLLDRLIFGSITDWLKLPWFSLWLNLADVYIVLGLGLVLGQSKIRRNEHT